MKEFLLVCVSFPKSVWLPTSAAGEPGRGTAVRTEIMRTTATVVWPAEIRISLMKKDGLVVHRGVEWLVAVLTAHVGAV